MTSWTTYKLQKMEIQYKYFNDGAKKVVTATETVTLKTNYKGFSIYTDKYSFWYYIQLNNEWRYFASLKEAKKFINETINN